MYIADNQFRLTSLYGFFHETHFRNVWLGGYLFDRTGSYDVVWWATVIIAAVTALIHVFIDERPVARLRQVKTAV